MTDLDARLRQVVAECLGVDPTQVTPEANLTADLHADSLDIIEIVMDAEEALGIEISDEAAETVRTYGDLLRAVAPTPTGAVQ